MRLKVCVECVWVCKWAAQIKTILVAKWEVPVSKRERLPKRVVTILISPNEVFGDITDIMVLALCSVI